jgi:hypothetical protein
MAQILFKNANLLNPDADALQGGVSVQPTRMSSTARAAR